MENENGKIGMGGHEKVDELLGGTGKMLNPTPVKFVVVLKSGGDYKPEHAIALANQVNKHLTVDYEFVCLTDMEVEFKRVNEKSVQLESNLPGWWSVQEVWRLDGKVIFTGLDTVILKSINGLAKIAEDTKPKTINMIHPFNKNEKWASGFMVWNGNWSWVYEKFKRNLGRNMRKYGGEQKFTWNTIEARSGYKIKAIQDSKYYKHKICSYKWHCKGKDHPPKNAGVVLFHGKPRPWECNEPWVKNAYMMSEKSKKEQSGDSESKGVDYAG